MPAMRIAFTKCHGSGNDFPMIDARGGALAGADWPAIARALSDRAGPVGGDGILLLTDGDDSHAFGFRMFNADGSEAETCLNGVRCVARAGFEASGLTQATLRLATSTAAVALDVPLAPGVVTVRETAGPVDLDAGAWLFGIGGERLIDRAVPGLSSDRAFTAVRMPNPHLVTFVDAVDEAELLRVGSFCETAPPLVPGRANVSFVEPRGGDLFVRTFERGVGLTDSCGSAMAASPFAACLTGRFGWDAEVTVFNRGGLVRASARQDGMVTLSGNATYEWTGDIDVTDGMASELVVARRFADEVAAWAEVTSRSSSGVR